MSHDGGSVQSLPQEFALLDVGPRPPPESQPFVARFLIDLRELSVHAEAIGGPGHGDINAEFFLAVSLAQKDIPYQHLTGGQHGVGHKVLPVDYLESARLYHFLDAFEERGVPLLYLFEQEGLLQAELKFRSLRQL
ncbi:hypothetical protein ES703_118546 [subsurface metagenome]